MKFFGKQKKDEPNNNPEKAIDDGLAGFEEQLENTLREERTQVITDKKEESKSKAMVRTLLDAGYSIIEINELISTKKTFGLKDGQITIMD